MSEVSAKNIGTAPKGFTIGNSARNVSSAAVGVSRRKYCTTFPGLMRRKF